jgi:hypothetical protein
LGCFMLERSFAFMSAILRDKVERDDRQSNRVGKPVDWPLINGMPRHLTHRQLSPYSRKRLDVKNFPEKGQRWQSSNVKSR